MLCSHRILCSCVPAPFFVFLRCATPSHFHLHALFRISPPCHLHTSICTTGARCHSDVSRMPACIPACPRPLAFPLHARCFPHDRSLHMPARRFPHTHARSHFHCVLAVSRMPVRCTPARCFPHARSPHCALVFSRTPARCLALPPLPRASSSASRFPSALRFPPASPHLHLASPLPRLARLCWRSRARCRTR
jgi:hypothetical protein